jgi:hypothetical protein
MTEATVFTLTTRFSYNGDGVRVSKEVVGFETTTYTLDYARNNRILVETTNGETTRYLYSEADRECLGEVRDDAWAYYLSDMAGQVRQLADEAGAISSTWLYNPDGTVLEGPEGPVSHLVCGGVYDGSTGLIYKDSRYFDPNLGLWLMMMPLAVMSLWPGRKRRGGFSGFSILLVMVCVGGLVVGCGGEKVPPTPTEELCLETMPMEAPLGDNFLFVTPNDCCDMLSDHDYGLKRWTVNQKNTFTTAMETAFDEFASEKGFGSINKALAAFGVSSGNPIRLARRDVSFNPNNPGSPAAVLKPVMFVFDPFFSTGHQAEILTHEMAHLWDQSNNHSLSGGMVGQGFTKGKWVNWGVPARSTYQWGPDACKECEDFATAVTGYFWPTYVEPGRKWTDDTVDGMSLHNLKKPDQLKMLESELDKVLIGQRDPHPDGTVQVKDRYDYVQMLLGKKWNSNE